MKAHVFCIFVDIRGVGHKLEVFLEAPYSPVVNTTRDIVLGKFTGCKLMFTNGKNAA